MVVEENWGVAMEKAARFLDVQPDVHGDASAYCFRSCRITLTALEPGQLGKVPFPRTRLRIEGPEEEVPIIRRRFLIQFLSAGG